METAQVPNYQASPQSNSSASADMSVKDWVITLVIMIIPLVNLIMLFVWAFGGDGRANSRTNWAKASLIVMAIVLVLYFVFGMLFFGAILSAANNM